MLCLTRRNREYLEISHAGESIRLIFAVIEKNKCHVRIDGNLAFRVRRGEHPLTTEEIYAPRSTPPPATTDP